MAKKKRENKEDMLKAAGRLLDGAMRAATTARHQAAEANELVISARSARRRANEIAEVAQINIRTAIESLNAARTALTRALKKE